jgi:hypothetical protein
MQVPGGGYPDGQSLEAYGMDPSVYLPMWNVLVDIHLYGWSSNFVPDQQVVTSALAALVRGGQSMTTVDGHVPVVIGEYGISTEGETPDANANQVLQVAQHSNLVIGAVAFTWSGSGPDILTDGQGHLTTYGQEVAQWIASGSQPVASANFAVTDQTKGSSSFEAGQAYVGPVAGLEKEFALITPDNLNITATVPNVFIRTGSGMDGINVSRANGNNILDGSTGSNFLIGGAGNDTFYMDNRNPNSPIFSTIVNFHAGDNVTVWGVNATDFTMLKLDHQGAIGATGLDLLFAAPGYTDTSFVMAGYTSADLTNGRLSLSYGKTQDIPGLPGSEYLTVHAN